MKSDKEFLISATVKLCAPDTGSDNAIYPAGCYDHGYGVVSDGKSWKCERQCSCKSKNYCNGPMSRLDPELKGKQTTPKASSNVVKPALFPILAVASATVHRY